MTTLEEFLTTTEVASSLGLHPQTIKKFLRLGKLKGKKVNNGWLIPKTEVKSLASTYSETRGRSTNGRGHRNGEWSG